VAASGRRQVIPFASAYLGLGLGRRRGAGNRAESGRRSAGRVRASRETLDAIDSIEAKEAFAVQASAVANELGFDAARISINGG